MEKTDVGILKPEAIQSKIFTIRGVQVMIDRDLAELYGVETKALNRAVKRNAERFPQEFMFQLTDSEWSNLRYHFGTSSEKHGGRGYLPFAFAESGVAMLASVLRSNIATNVSIQIMTAFIQMRKIIANNSLVLNRLDRVERKQLEANRQFEIIFEALESKQLDREKGIFYDSQVFDAYTFVADIIRKASSSIILIDNYVDDTVLSLFTKRKKGGFWRSIWTNTTHSMLVYRFGNLKHRMIGFLFWMNPSYTISVLHSKT
ncbi:ORF6N domain-containing protein [Parapedobacter tibetensis]|uniref:ORF6N domain-containing protein n=1 Tax=Parapedobacter tibetensis TaxID=2972951 RepID=UPI00214DA986